MSVNSITTDAAAFTLKPLTTALSLDQSAKPVTSTNGQLSSQTVTPSVVPNDNNKVSSVSSANRQSPDARNESNKKPVRAMNHVVESYNQQGKVRIKFMDSNNNVIYQIPTEMVAKMEDQMMKPEISADIKG
jgi:hypothetical protein